MDQTGRILSVPPVGERMAPHPALSPSDGERAKTRWQQARARPLTPALSPSDGEREKRDCAAAGGTDKMRSRGGVMRRWSAVRMFGFLPPHHATTPTPHHAIFFL